MAFLNSKPLELIYNEVNHGRYNSVKHYETQDASNPFTNLINIAKDRGFAKSNPNYWLKTKEGKKWSKNALSGLFKTSNEHIFWGDIKSNGRKTNTFLVEFSKDAEELKVYYFDYYTQDVENLISSIH